MKLLFFHTATVPSQSISVNNNYCSGWPRTIGTLRRLIFACKNAGYIVQNQKMHVLLCIYFTVLSDISPHDWSIIVTVNTTIESQRTRTTPYFFIESCFFRPRCPLDFALNAKFASRSKKTRRLSLGHLSSRKCAETPARLQTDLPAPTSPLAAAQCASVVSRLTRLQILGRGVSSPLLRCSVYNVGLAFCFDYLSLCRPIEEELRRKVSYIVKRTLHVGGARQGLVVVVRRSTNLYRV